MTHTDGRTGLHKKVLPKSVTKCVWMRAILPDRSLPPGNRQGGVRFLGIGYRRNNFETG
jgi:hypothetical protein